MSKGETPRIPGQRITSRREAAALIAALAASMDALRRLFEEETQLVRAGKLSAAGELAAVKQEKAAEYTRLMMLARDEVRVLTALEPEASAELRHQHELFRAEMQINLAVLATARDVAEDLMRSVATEVGRAQAPAVYGYPGARPKESATARGIAIDRSL